MNESRPQLVVLFHLAPEIRDSGRWTNTQPSSIFSSIDMISGGLPLDTIFYYTPDDPTDPYNLVDVKGSHIDFRRVVDTYSRDLFLDAKRIVYHQITHPVAHGRRAFAIPEVAERGIQAELLFSLRSAQNMCEQRNGEQVIVVQDFPMIMSAWLSTRRVLEPSIKEVFGDLFTKYGLGHEFASHCKMLAAMNTPEPLMSWFHHTCIPTKQSWESVKELDSTYARVLETMLSKSNIIVQSKRDLDNLEELVGDTPEFVFRRVQPFGFNLTSRLEIASGRKQLSYWEQIRDDVNLTPQDIVVGVITREDDPKNNLHTVFTSIHEMIELNPEIANHLVVLLQTQRTRNGGDYHAQVERNNKCYEALTNEFPYLRIGWYRDGDGKRGNVVSALSDVFLATGSPGGLEVTPVETLHFANQRYEGKLDPKCQELFDQLRGNRDRPVSLVVSSGAGISEHLVSTQIAGVSIFNDGEMSRKITEAIINPPVSFSQDQYPGFQKLLGRLDGATWFRSLVETSFGITKESDISQAVGIAR